MNTETVRDAINRLLVYVGTNKMNVYVNVNGSLMPLDRVRMETMRDSDGDVPIMVLDPKTDVEGLRQVFFAGCKAAGGISSNAKADAAWDAYWVRQTGV